MIRRVLPSWAPSRLQSEVRFTRAALEADPNSLDLLPLTDHWAPLVQGDLGCAAATADLDAKVRADRKVAHALLKDAITAFSVGLLAEVKNNRSDPRFLAFFTVSPTDLNELAQERLLSEVRRWLAHCAGEAFASHRAELEGCASRLQAALDAGKALQLSRMDRDTSHEKLCKQLSVEREALFAELRDRAEERGLLWGWPRRFFDRA